MSVEPRLADRMGQSTSGAIFSANRKYRYALWRKWGLGNRLVHLCGLNPSTADETEDDPTIRREIDFASSWGFDGLVKTNAFGFRATDPRVLKGIDDPSGPENNYWINEAHVLAEFSVACWGVNCTPERQKFLRERFSWQCFGLTKDGFPKHPLYLKKDTPLVHWP